MQCKIVLSFTYRNHLGQVNDQNQEFFSIEHFEQHLRRVPDKAMLLGVIKPDAETLRLSNSSNVRVSLVAGDEFFTFTRYKEFEDFLGENMAITRNLI